MKFFFDRNLSVHIARMIDDFERAHDVVHQDDDGRFGPDDPDVAIVDRLTAELPRPVLVTADVRQRRDQAERLALSESGLTMIFFKGGFHRLTFHDQALGVLRVWPTIVEESVRCRRPTVFEVSPACRKVDRVCLTADLARRLRGR